MNTTVMTVILAVAGLVLGFVLSLIYYKTSTGKKIKETEEKAGSLLENAKREANSITKEAMLEAKDTALRLKSEAEKELQERRQEQNQLDKRLRQREEMFDRKLDQLDKKDQNFNRKERDLSNREKSLQEKEKEHEDILNKQKEVLAQLSNLSVEDAKKELLGRIEEESRFEAAKIAKRVEDEAIEGAERKAKEVMSVAIQRSASDFVSDHTISTVSLPNDEMKGRIIGREGRNIRALEAATGVEYVIDDTPETVLLSCFDPVRRGSAGFHSNVSSVTGEYTLQGSRRS